MTEEHDPLVEALAAYSVAPPSADFASRVVAEHNRLRRRRRAFAIAAWAAAAVLFLGVGFALWPRAQQGEIVALERTAEDLGPLTVVAARGARIRWKTHGDAAELTQQAGSVFYRIERGTQVRVAVPGGEVVVRGTCFAVHIMNRGDEMGSRHAGWYGAVGIAVGALATVTVYEGRVALANDDGTVALEAGETGWLEAEGPPQRRSEVAEATVEGEAVNDAAGEPSAFNEPEHGEVPDVALEGALEGADRTALLAEIQRLRRDTQRLAQANQQLSAEARAGSEGPHRARWFPVSRTELAELAERCSIRLDLPPVFSTEPSIPEGDEMAFLAEGEHAIVAEVIRREHRRLREAIQQLYVEATGDVAGASTLSASSMLEEMIDKAPPEDRHVYRRLSQERAGLAQPPPQEAQSPTEQAVRLMADSPDGFQRALAESLGPERAQELREANGGWPWGRSQYSGCGPE